MRPKGDGGSGSYVARGVGAESFGPGRSRSILVSIFVNPYEQSGKDAFARNAIHQLMLHSLRAPTQVAAPSCRAVSSSGPLADVENPIRERVLLQVRVRTEKA